MELLAALLVLWGTDTKKEALKAHEDALAPEMDAVDAQMDADDVRTELMRVKVEYALAELGRLRQERPLLTIERDIEATILRLPEADAAGDDASVRAAAQRLQMIGQLPEYRLGRELSEQYSRLEETKASGDTETIADAMRRAILLQQDIARITALGERWSTVAPGFPRADKNGNEP